MPVKTLAVLLSAIAMLPAAHAQESPPEEATVIVAGRRDPVVRKLDRTVHDTSTMAKAANGTAQDVLQAIPELTVTADGSIAVNGNRQVTVLVDGKPTALLAGSGDERAVALQTMNGADIAGIEIITNPSAAWQANGGALVNIVLKRNRKPGARAQLQGAAADHGLWNVGASGDAATRQVSIHGNAAWRHDGTRKIRGSTVEWRNPATGMAGQTAQASDVFIRRVVGSAALGIDARLSDADSLSLSARHNARRSRPLFDVRNELREGTASSTYHRISEGPNEQADNSFNVGYTHQGQGTALKAAVQHSTTAGLVDKSYRDEYAEPAQAAAYSRGATQSSRRITGATLDWTRASRHGQWGMGLDQQDKADDIANYQAAIDSATGAETPDPTTTNGYTVTTALTAAYVTGQLRHGNWEALLGGRAERMALRVRSAQGTASPRHWQAFNPSLHVKHALTDKTDLTLTYRRSLQMPDPRDLNPFTAYIDAQNLSRGNPLLAPQRVTAWEIGANAEVARLSGSVGAFYRASRATVTDARSMEGNVIVSSKRNGGQARSVGVTSSLDWTPTPSLRFGIDGGIHLLTFHTPDLAERVRQDGTASYVNARASYSAGPDDVSLDAHFQSAAIAPLGRAGATSSVNVAWKRKLTGTVTLTVNANDLFDGSRRTYSTTTGTFRQDGFEHFVARRIYVGLVKKLE